MNKRLWNESISVGIGIVDAQHQNLFSYYNELIEALESGSAAEVLEDVLDRLKGYAVYHFDTEVGLMKKYGFPDADEHQKAHEEYLVAIEEFDLRKALDDPDVAEEMVAFLSNWITRHIKTRDMEFAGFLEAGGKVL